MSCARIARGNDEFYARTLKVDSLVSGDKFLSDPDSAYSGTSTNTSILSLEAGDNKCVSLPDGNANSLIWGWYGGVAAWTNDGMRLGQNINPAAPNCSLKDSRDGTFINIEQDGSIRLGYCPKANNAVGDAVKVTGEFDKDGFKGIASGSETLDGSGDATVAVADLTTSGVVVVSSQGATAANVVSVAAGQFEIAGGAGEDVNWVVLHL